MASSDAGIICEAIAAQLEKPSSTLDSQAGGVVNRLHQLGRSDLAAEYWRLATGTNTSWLAGHPEVVGLHARIHALDMSAPRLPAWATYGT